MLTPTQIRNMEFQKTSIGGYKPIDVDCFLEEIATTTESLYKENSEMLEKLNLLANKIEEYRKDEDSIHTALLNAQRLADKVLKEAREQAEVLQSSAQKRADEIVNAANSKAEATLNKANKTTDDLIKTTRKNAERLTNETKEKTDRMIAAAVDSVSRQQQVFNQLKAEVASFRSSLLARYKTHVEMITLIPNEVSNDPTAAAENVEKDFDSEKTKAEEQAQEVAARPEAEKADKSDKMVDTQELEIAKEISGQDKAEKSKNAFQAKPPRGQMKEKQGGEEAPKKGFRVVVEDNDEEVKAASGLKFGGDYSAKNETKQDEVAGFGFFKKRK